MIRYEVTDGVAVITLDRPERLNALPVEMREALVDRFEEALRDERVRRVLLQAIGRIFCAGGDVGKIATETLNRAASYAPSDIFRVQDGWIIAQSVGSAMFKRWASLIGKPELFDDPRFTDDLSRGKTGSF